MIDYFYDSNLNIESNKLKKDIDDVTVGESASCYVVLSSTKPAYLINKKTGTYKDVSLQCYKGHHTLLCWADEDGHQHAQDIFKLMYQVFINNHVKFISNVEPKDGDWTNYKVDNLIKVRKPHFNARPLTVKFKNGETKEYLSLNDMYRSFGITEIIKHPSAAQAHQ